MDEVTRTRFAALLTEAAWIWLDEHGDPYVDQFFPTHHCHFLGPCESIFIEAVKERRQLQTVRSLFAPQVRGRFWLYRLFNEDDRLLYIGVTRNPPARLAAHRKKWGELISHVTWEERPSAEDALLAEKKAIESEHPMLNIEHPKVPDGAA